MQWDGGVVDDEDLSVGAFGENGKIGSIVTEGGGYEIRFEGGQDVHGGNRRSGGRKEGRVAGSDTEEVEHVNGHGVMLPAISCCNRDGR